MIPSKHTALASLISRHSILAVLRHVVPDIRPAKNPGSLLDRVNVERGLACDAEAEYRRIDRILRIGLPANIILVVLTLLYVWLTPSGPNRELIAVLSAQFLAVLVTVSLVPRRLIARARWSPVFFHGWSITCLGLTYLLIWLDGGVDSPTLLYLYMIMLFASMYHSVTSNIIYAGAGIFGYCLVALMEPFDPGMGMSHLFRLVLLMLAYGFCTSIAWHRSLLARENEKMRRQLEDRTLHDSLTGCLNRRGLIDALGREVARSQRSHDPVSLLLIDIDHFKQINDEMGHLQGDRVLCRVAAMLMSMTRRIDVFGRLGGDEFVLVSPDTGSDGAVILARRLREAVSRLEWPRHVTLSIGICSVVCTQEARAEGLLDQADKALYEVKRQGRNGVWVVDMRIGHTKNQRAAL